MVTNSDVLPALRASAWLGDCNLFVPDCQAWGLGAGWHLPLRYTEFPEFVPLVIGMEVLMAIAMNVDQLPSAELCA